MNWYKFKSEKSLTRKIFRNSQKLVETISADKFSNIREIEKFLAEIAEKTNDVLRYTFIFPLEIYVSAFAKTILKLEDCGYKIEVIWNAWRDIETRYDTGYRGINATVTSSQGQIFELQFHTKESFELKVKTHKLYKMAVSDSISGKHRKQIIQTMCGLAENVATPEGAKNL